MCFRLCRAAGGLVCGRGAITLPRWDKRRRGSVRGRNHRPSELCRLSGHDHFAFSTLDNLFFNFSPWFCSLGAWINRVWGGGWAKGRGNAGKPSQVCHFDAINLLPLVQGPCVVLPVQKLWSSSNPNTMWDELGHGFVSWLAGGSRNYCRASAKMPHGHCASSERALPGHGLFASNPDEDIKWKWCFLLWERLLV